MNLQCWLLVLDAIVKSACTDLGFNIIFSLSTSAEVSCFYTFAGIDINNLLIANTLQFLVFCILYPFTGWLADIKIGREKAIHIGLWLCWFGTLLQVISYCIQYGTCGLPVNIAKYGISGVALVMLIVGTAGLSTNIPPYGLDQLYEKPNTHSRAFIHWIVWGYYVGYSVGYIAFVPQTIRDPTLLLVTIMLIFLMASAALFFHARFNYKFELSGVLKKNPYKMVYQTLKYAWQHTSPENRSALTYWEKKMPKRIDLGKQKYGGPFKEIEIEDTKTFWRIITVLVSTFGFYIVYFHTVLGVLRYTNSYRGATNTLGGYGSYALWSSFDEVIIILVPLVEFVIVPLFPKIEYFIKPLRGFCVAYILITISLISIIAIDIVGHFITPGCFLSTTSNDKPIDMSYLYYIIPFAFSSVVGGLSTISMLEFIASQAPVNMSAMLTGLFWLIRSVYNYIGVSLLIPFTYFDFNGPGKLSCSFWSLLIQLFICVFGFIVYVVISKRYKQRKREENYDAYMMNVLEDNYVRKFDAIGTKDDTDEVIVIESLSSPYLPAEKAFN